MLSTLEIRRQIRVFVMKLAPGMPAARWLAIAVLSAGLMGTVGASGPDNHVSIALSGRMAKLPRLTVWAWERREDLRGLNAQTTAVAYLDRTVAVDATGLHIEPRR